MYNRIELAENVARGAQLLDTRVPNWFNTLDLDTLDLYSCDACVIGQLYTEFADGISALTGSHDFRERSAFATTHGFDLFREARSERAVYAGFKVLRDLWVTEILTRQARTHDQRSSDLPAQTCAR